MNILRIYEHFLKIIALYIYFYINSICHVPYFFVLVFFVVVHVQDNFNILHNECAGSLLRTSINFLSTKPNENFQKYSIEPLFHGILQNKRLITVTN